MLEIQKKNNLKNSIERMYFKREHVEQCNRMKRKLRTEQSYQKPETKSVTIETVSELQERF